MPGEKNAHHRAAVAADPPQRPPSCGLFFACSKLDMARFKINSRLRAGHAATCDAIAAQQSRAAASGDVVEVLVIGRPELARGDKLGTVDVPNAHESR